MGGMPKTEKCGRLWGKNPEGCSGFRLLQESRDSLNWDDRPGSAEVVAAGCKLRIGASPKGFLGGEDADFGRWGGRMAQLLVSDEWINV